MKGILYYYKNLSLLILTSSILTPWVSLGSSKGSIGCAGKFEIGGGYASPFEFNDSSVSKSQFFNGHGSVLAGPKSSVACASFGFASNRAQEYYKIDVDGQKKTITLMQSGFGLRFAVEFDLWLVLNSMRSFFITPTVGVEGLFGLALNQSSKEVDDVALSKNLNGYVHSFGLNLGLRGVIFDKFGWLGTLSQSRTFFRFSHANLAFQHLTYSFGVSYQIGK